MAEYFVLYDFIKNELCINKDKPKLQCNGKCYLMKELAKAAESQDNEKNKKQVSSENNIVFFQEIKACFVSRAFVGALEENINHCYNTTYHFSNSNSVFRPPIS